MRNIILKTPIAIWVLILFSPIILLLMNKFFPIESDLLLFTLGILRTIIPLAILLWCISALDFFCKEKKNYKFYGLIIGLLVLQFILSYFLNITQITYVRYLLTSIVHIPIVILFTKKIKQVFYLRSTWWIVFELIVIPIGIITLSKEIRNWKNEKEVIE